MGNSVFISAGGFWYSQRSNLAPLDLFQFDLVVPQGIGFVHIPLKVTRVAGEAKVLETVGDVYDILGNNVNFLITLDTEEEPPLWRSYLGAQSRGSKADVLLTDQLGIITVMQAATTLRLTGVALGLGGKSQISLVPGLNQVGIPLQDSNFGAVSDLLNLPGVSSIIVADEGEFKLIAAAGDDGDGPIQGDRSYIIVASEPSTTEITGDGWSNVLQ